MKHQTYMVHYLRKYYARATNFLQRIFHISISWLYELSQRDVKRWFLFKKCLRHTAYLLKTRGEPTTPAGLLNFLADLNWIMFLRYGHGKEKYFPGDWNHAADMRAERKYWGWNPDYTHFSMKLYEQEEALYFGYAKDVPSGTYGQPKEKLG